MQLTDADILEFQTMCQEHLGIELEWSEAQDRAIKFVRMMQIVHQPMRVEEFEAIRDQDKQCEATNEDENNHDDSVQP